MVTLLSQKVDSFTEYLTLEEQADYRSEYIDGEIIAMSGGTTNHNQIIVNLSTELNLAFKRQNYRIFTSDVRLWIPEKRIFTYPDLMVINGEIVYYETRKDVILNPVLIAEVLSKSTQNYDKKDKFNAYKTIPTFQEYLLISQEAIQVDHYFKLGQKRWQIQDYDAADERISFESIPSQIDLADLYNKVEFVSEEIVD